MSVLAINAVMERSKSKGSARVLLICLANYCGDDGVTLFFVTNKRLQRHANLTERQVRYQLNALKRIGEIVAVATAQNGSHRYRLNLPLAQPKPGPASGPQFPQDPQARQSSVGQHTAANGATPHREEGQSFALSNKKNTKKTNKPAPTSSADVRFRPVRDCIVSLYAEATGMRRDLVPWDGRDGAALAAWLETHKVLSYEDVQRLVETRFDSDVNPAQRPATWIPKLMEYWSGPLNQYGLPRWVDREFQREERRRAEARIGTR
jgi:hypothetical protein